MYCVFIEIGVRVTRYTTDFLLIHASKAIELAYTDSLVNDRNVNVLKADLMVSRECCNI